MEAKEFDDLVKKLYAGEKKYEDKVIKYLMPLAKQISRKISKDYEEGVAIGYFIIVKYVKNIEQLQNIKNFKSLVSMRIAGAIRDEERKPKFFRIDDYPYEDTNIGFNIAMEELLKEFIRDELRIEIVKALMEGYKQCEVAEQFNISPSYISKMKERFWE